MNKIKAQYLVYLMIIHLFFLYDTVSTSVFFLANQFTFVPKIQVLSRIISDAHHRDIIYETLFKLQGHFTKYT